MTDIKSIEYHRKMHDIKKTITTAELYEYIVKLHTVVTDLHSIIEIQDKEIKIINERLIKLMEKCEDGYDQAFEDGFNYAKKPIGKRNEI